MKIKKIKLLLLRNDAHFQFHTEFKKLIDRFGAEELKVAELFAVYLPLYQNVDEGLKKVNRSVLTSKIKEADKARDEIWSGLVEMNNAATKHFDSNIKEAAKRLKIVFDTYGNLSIKPINEETSAIYNILQEFEGKYAKDTETVGVDKWVAELKARNNALSELIKERFEESASKSKIVVKEARAELDGAYRAITERIDALVVVEGVADYEVFVRTWNAVVEKYAV